MLPLILTVLKGRIFNGGGGIIPIIGLLVKGGTSQPQTRIHKPHEPTRNLAEVGLGSRVSSLNHQGQNISDNPCKP